MVIKLADNKLQIDKALHEALKKCVSNDEHRPQLWYTYIKEGKTIYATNGQMLLYLDLPEAAQVQEGFYELSFMKQMKKYYLTKIEVEGQFPNAEAILEQNTDWTEKIDIKLPKQNLTEYSIFIFKLFDFIKTPINMRLLKNLDGFANNGITIERQEDNSRAIRLNLIDGVKAIIMPMRII